MNTCDHGHQTHGQIRALPLSGGANILVCHGHYQREMEYRRERGRQTGMDKWRFPRWFDLELIAAEAPDAEDLS